MTLIGPEISENIKLHYRSIKLHKQFLHETIDKDNYTEVNKYIILAYISN